jgi:hypothetical protein
VPEPAPARTPARTSRNGLPALLLAGTLLGALVLAASQFMTLANTRIQASRGAVETVTAGSEHAYALLPVAVLAALLAYGIWKLGSRPALLAVGILGLISLLISLLRDLPYAHRTGVRMFAGHYVSAANSAGAGLYVETLGAMLLLVTCVSGFILLGPPRRVLSDPLQPGRLLGDTQD